jgi:hypothetical protein
MSLPPSQPAFRHITELENHGVNRADINKLMESGFCTVQAVSPPTKQGDATLPSLPVYKWPDALLATAAF